MFYISDEKVLHQEKIYDDIFLGTCIKKGEILQAPSGWDNSGLKGVLICEDPEFICLDLGFNRPMYVDGAKDTVGFFYWWFVILWMVVVFD